MQLSCRPLINYSKFLWPLFFRMASSSKAVGVWSSPKKVVHHWGCSIQKLVKHSHMDPTYPGKFPPNSWQLLTANPIEPPPKTEPFMWKFSGLAPGGFDENRSSLQLTLSQSQILSISLHSITYPYISYIPWMVSMVLKCIKWLREEFSPQAPTRSAEPKGAASMKNSKSIEFKVGQVSRSAFICYSAYKGWTISPCITDVWMQGWTCDGQGTGGPTLLLKARLAQQPKWCEFTHWQYRRRATCHMHISFSALHILAPLLVYQQN